eukprot:CAMPEP_0194110990 /NCGR_PEP_ID=MMETSP0150-20130528/10097_1 /TAXON_ID=122233 /ORGANISM="Chaetoceros debilis, Strain MM31A-1" /LENGTH=271 /DNA_ID=CAMNT_0038800297 /DNA_START=279 /DNA_END=1094 /DNA_ORIENTATION=-
MNPWSVIYAREYYRIISSCFFHGSIMHIAMNMLSLAAIGTTLETSFGSMWTFFTICCSILLTGVVYILIAVLGSIVKYNSLMQQHSLGFSGILFHLLVIESARNPNASQSLFGMAQVSSRVYPWVLLVAIQVIMPNISFVGHLSGILVGTMQTAGLLNYVLPGVRYLRSLDESDRLYRITCQPNFVKTPSESAFTLFSRSNSQLQLSVPAIITPATATLRGVCDKIRVAVLGNGRAGNENIYFDEENVISMTEALIPDEEDPAFVRESALI